jgi:hypothetical protein
LALLDMEGHGSEEKSICPRRIESKMTCSVSAYETKKKGERQDHQPHLSTVHYLLFCSPCTQKWSRNLNYINFT